MVYWYSLQNVIKYACYIFSNIFLIYTYILENIRYCNYEQFELINIPSQRLPKFSTWKNAKKYFFVFYLFLFMIEKTINVLYDNRSCCIIHCGSNINIEQIPRTGEELVFWFFSSDVELCKDLVNLVCLIRNISLAKRHDPYHGSILHHHDTIRR